MLSYEKLDAWKGCHSLMLTVYETTKDRIDQDPDLIGGLRWTALRATAKLAFGCGSHNRKLFLLSVERASGSLSEFGYHLALTRAIGLLPSDQCTRLDALRGRASFYTWQLRRSLIEVPDGRGEPYSPFH